MSIEKTNLECLRILWKQLGDIPVDNYDRILEDFVVFDYLFPKGTSKFDVWYWFDERCPNNLHDDLMFKKGVNNGT